MGHAALSRPVRVIILNADKIVVLEGKRIIETGTHEELMRVEGGLYRHLNEVQMNIEPRLAALRAERQYQAVLTEE